MCHFSENLPSLMPPVPTLSLLLLSKKMRKNKILKSSYLKFSLVDFDKTNVNIFQKSRSIDVMHFCVSQSNFKFGLALRSRGGLRANAQKNRAKFAKCGHSSKPNLPSFSVYNKVLMSL